MLIVCQKTLQPAFDEKNHALFEEEVHRLFRTNEFNVAVHLKEFKVFFLPQINTSKEKIWIKRKERKIKKRCI